MTPTMFLIVCGLGGFALSLFAMYAVMEDCAMIRVKLHKNGNCTVSGLSFERLRSLETAASLYRYDHPYKAKLIDPDTEKVLPGIQERNNRSGKEWHRIERWVCDSLKAAIDKAIDDTHPRKAPIPLRTRLRQNKKAREALQRILRELGLAA